ncbi:hypothetical protein D3C85_1268470 [compost metagenome]
MNVLINIRSISGSKVFLLVHHEQNGVDVIRTTFHGCIINRQQEVYLFFNGNFKGILFNRSFPADLPISFLCCQFYGFRL